MPTFNLKSCVFAAVCAMSASAQAATIVAVDGTDAEAVPFGIAPTDPIGVASQFRLEDSYTDVSISVDFFCTGDCRADFYLSNGELGAGGSVLDIIALSVFDSATASTEIFSGLSLGAGLYSIVMVFTDGASGFGLWEATASPDIDTDGRASDGQDFLLTDLDFNSVTRSQFEPTQLDLLYAVDGTPVPTPVPLPATGGLILGAMAGLSLLRRRRS